MDALCQKGFLSGNMLKIIGAIFMLIDHIGMFLPKYRILRIIGRLSFPIFAFMIGEGARYTKNKAKYFSLIFLLGVLCQIVTYIYNKSMYMCILITFSISIILIFVYERLKHLAYDKSVPFAEKVRWTMLFMVLVLGVYFINIHIQIDYGFWGCMLPLVLSLFNGIDELDNLRIKTILLFLGLVPVCVSLGGIQWYCLLSVLLLMMYSGERGKYKMKYFFYVFYPVHLALLQLIFEYI